eukprot:COSAG06_NODE_2776_length_6301_cov_523.080780_2_plen_79_part_00
MSSASQPPRSAKPRVVAPPVASTRIGATGGSAPPQFADEGEHNYVPDRLAEVFNSGVATLTWRTSGFCAGGGHAPLIN